MNITIVTGSRADWGLLEPVVRNLTRQAHMDIIVTGSHLSKQFGETWRDIPKELWPKCILTPCLIDWDNPAGVTMSMGNALLSIPSVYANLRPDMVVLLGDRFEIFAAAIAAYNMGIPIAHIQNDDVTLGSLDDGYRKCISELATLRFPVDEYGSLGCVFPEELDQTLYPCVEYLCIYHPYKGNFKENFIKVLDVLKDKHIMYIGSNADAGGRLINSILYDYGLGPVQSLPRWEYLSVLSKVKAIIGNSSSGIIEAPSLRTATINIGDRQKGRQKASSVIDCKADKKSIEGALRKAEEIDWDKVVNPYYKENSVERICDDIIAGVLGDRPSIIETADG